MFKRIAAVLAGRKARANPPAPELESVPAFDAHLRAKGLSAEEASDVMVDRYCAMRRYWLAKGYTDDQHGKMPTSQQLTIPTGEADKKLYWQCYRSMKDFRRFFRPDFTPT